MMRLLFVLVTAGVAALGAAWIADHDAALTLTVAGYEVRTTAAVAVAILLVCFFVLWVVLGALFAILRSLAKASGWASVKRGNSTVQGDAKLLPSPEQPS